MIKVKPNIEGIENMLENENNILTHLKILARGEPTKVGIIEKFDFVSIGQIVPPKKYIRKANVLPCNAIVITLLESDLYHYVKPDTYKTSARKIFQYTYDLVKNLFVKISILINKKNNFQSCFS